MKDTNKIGDVNAIRIYGSNNVSIPAPKANLVKLFDVPAEMYMTVPEAFLADIIRFLKYSGWVFKMKELTKYTVFALQYEKP